MVELKRQEDYITITENHGEEIARKLEHIEGGGKLDSGVQKLLSDLIKEEKYSGSKKMKM